MKNPILNTCSKKTKTSSFNISPKLVILNLILPNLIFIPYYAYAQDTSNAMDISVDSLSNKKGNEQNIKQDNKQVKEWKFLLNELKKLDYSLDNNTQVVTPENENDQELESNLNRSISLLTENEENTLAISKLDGSEKVIGLDDYSFEKAINEMKPIALDTNNTSIETSGLAHLITHKSTQNKQATSITGVTLESKIPKEDKQIQGLPFDPTSYLPEYQPIIENPDKTTIKPEIKTNKALSLIQKIKINLLHDGLPPLPKIEVEIYHQSKLKAPRVSVDGNQQPYKNIETALEEIYLDTIIDFTSALPTLHKTAKEAAKAVGYYDVQLSFLQAKDNGVEVIIESVGEPVKVENRLIDVRGEGSDMGEFQAMEDTLPPLAGQIFNQGAYKASKSVINAKSSQMGFFDGQWLNSSADVILPDNTADIDLIYDTGSRYKFGDVVFFTFDEDSQKLTTDPDKLPVKRELLEKLVTFKEGDDYYSPKINELRNDLAATGYFNRANVEEISSKIGSGGDGISFEMIADDDSKKSKTATEMPVDIALVAFPNLPIGEKTGLSIEDLDIASIAKIAKANAHNSKDTLNPNQLLKTKYDFDGTADSIIDNLINSTIEDAISSNSESIDEKTAQKQLASITFSIDTSTNEKLQAIVSKANNLLILPDDSVLNKQAKSSKSTLGKLSDAISSVAKAILPDETQTTETLEENRPELANKKTPKQVKESKKVPLYVFVATNKPYDAQLGFGYGTDIGFRTTVKLDNNLINRDGYKAGISGEWSNVEKKVGIHATRPWKHPIDDTFSSNLSYEEKIINQGNNNDWTTKTMQAGVARNRYSDKGWNRNFSLRYRNDKLDLGTDISADPADLPVRFNSSNPTQQALLLGYSMHKTETDDHTNPESGYRQHYSLELGLNDVGTDTNMAIARAGVSGVYSFGESDKHQVVGKLNTGYLWAEDFADVPYTLRFFAGGDQSIRGYDYNSLSPVENGYLTGGQILAAGSAEYNYEFKEGLRGAVFADVGNAYDKYFQTPSKVGVGFGVRWASPVGPVRLDVGAGVTEESIPIRLHLFIGSPL